LKLFSLAGVATAAALGVFAVAHAEDAAKPAGQNGSDEATAAAKKDPKKDPDRLVCKKFDDTGTRTATKKVCMKASDWSARSASDREQFEESQRYKNPGSSN
jgi:hypothetical protein